MGFGPQDIVAYNDEALRTKVVADVVYREGATLHELVRDLDRILRDELNLPMRLSVREIDSEVVIVSGKFRFTPIPGVDSYIAVNKDRVGLNDGNKIATDPDAQMALAEALSTIDECQTILYRNFDVMVSAAKLGSQPPIAQRIKMRFDAALVSRKCSDAINHMFTACGAQGIFRDHPLNRAWLDINAGRNHVANNPFKFGRNLGGTMMGQPNSDFFL